MNIPSTPFRLGYFLERRHEKCFGWPAIEYRGIDRLDFAPADNHERTAEEESLENAYLEALDSGELNSNRQVASYYEELFLELGIDVEVVYAEVTWTPESDADWFVPGFNAWRKVHESLG